MILCVSSQERCKADQEQNEVRLQAADLLHAVSRHIHDDLLKQQALQRRVDRAFKIGKEDPDQIKVFGHEDRCEMVVRGVTLEFADRKYDDPLTGMAEHAYFIGGHELLVSRYSQGAEASFGILLLTDQCNEAVTSVQAKYHINGGNIPMPVELICDTALVLHEERTTGEGIVPLK